MNGYVVVLGFYCFGDDECSLFFDVDDFGKVVGYEVFCGY